MSRLPLSIVSLLWIGCGSSPALDDARPGDAPPDVPADARIDAAIDAPAPAFDCLGMAAPTTAPDPLPVTGKLFAIDHYEVAPLANATVVLRRTSDDGVIAQVTTDSDGAFAMQVRSGGAAVAAYFTVDIAGFMPSRIDPGEALSGGEDALLIVAKQDELERWYTDAKAPFVSGTRTLITATVDCARKSVAGATLAVTPAPATKTYYDETLKRWNPALAAGSTNGFTLSTASDAHPTATATVGTATYPPHAVTVPAGTLTVRVLTPRL